jgi:hypothetical protein
MWIAVTLAGCSVFVPQLGCDGKIASRSGDTTHANTASGGATTDDGSANTSAILFGGLMSANGPSYVGSWIWNGGTWTRTGWNPPEIDSAESIDDAQIAVATYNDVPMLFGVGPTVEQQLGSNSWATWTWSYEEWAHHTVSPITVRNGFAVAAWTECIIVFGGLSEQSAADTKYLSDLWKWDGTSWTQLPSSGPSGRANAMMASLGNTLVLFGGATDAAEDASAGNSSRAFLSDTWTWDGTSWTQRSETGPSARAEAVLAPLRGHLILFGGETADGSPSSETWSWDGTAWTELNADGPSARRAAAMTPVDGKLLLFGGVDVDGNALGDTWTFDGSSWARETPTTNPPGLISASMAGF